MKLNLITLEGYRAKYGGKQYAFNKVKLPKVRCNQQVYEKLSLLASYSKLRYYLVSRRT